MPIPACRSDQMLYFFYLICTIRVIKPNATDCIVQYCGGSALIRQILYIRCNSLTISLRRVYRAKISQIFFELKRITLNGGRAVFTAFERFFELI